MTENVERLISVAEAMAILDSEPVAPRVRRAALADSRGSVLAAEIRADRDYPPFDKSVMDGYAVRSADVCDGPFTVDIVGEIAAGQWPSRGIGSGEAMAIMTGAPLPAGADAVIPIEWTEGADLNRLRHTIAAGQMIVRRGSDCRAGDIVLAAGTPMGAAQIAVAASIGAAEVSIYEKPRVAVMSSGDEIVPIAATPGTAQIRNSNSAMLSALLRGRGWCAECRELDPPADDPAAIAAALRGALDNDAIFLSGGMSMGKYDFVPKVLRDLGIETKISKLRIKPGKPFVFGVWKHDKGTTFVFGLPGNPVSAFVCTLRLASRILRRLCGERGEILPRRAKLMAAAEANGGREFYQPAQWDEGGVIPLKWKGSGDVFTLASAQLLIVRPENDPARATGFEVEIVDLWSAPLKREFYEQDAEPLARALVGKIIIYKNHRARIVETEAYVGPHDLACHSSKGQTARTDVMFGRAGHAYIYFIYGMYDMFNIVAGGACGQAVLIRAAEPMDGWEADLSGPGKLCRAFGITRADNRADLTAGSFVLEEDGTSPNLGRSRRIGVDYAMKWKHALLRFYDKDSVAVSKHPRRIGNREL